MVDSGDIILTFIPQVWMNNYAITVDPQGETQWQPSPEWTARMFEMHGDAALESMTYESDEWRQDEAAPEWVRDWSGPFEVHVKIGEHA